MPILCTSLHAQESAATEASLAAPTQSQNLAIEPSAVQKSFEELPTQEQETFIGHLKQASSLISRDRLLEAFNEIEKAEEIFKEYPSIYNLKGAAWVRLKEVDKARQAFKKALALNPKAFDVQFNLAELLFVERKFPQALSAFQNILTQFPQLHSDQYHLVQYKTQICHLQLGQMAEADKIEQSFTYTDDTPAYYYTRIAKAYATDDTSEASDWLRSAANIFQPNENQIYLDALVEMGWISALDKPTVDIEETP